MRSVRFLRLLGRLVLVAIALACGRMIVAVFQQDWQNLATGVVVTASTVGLWFLASWRLNRLEQENADKHAAKTAEFPSTGEH